MGFACAKFRFEEFYEPDNLELMAPAVCKRTDGRGEIIILEVNQKLVDQTAGGIIELLGECTDSFLPI